MKIPSVVASLLFLLAVPVFALAQDPEPMYVFVGTYSPADANGIHVYKLDPVRGELSPVSAVSGVKNPSFVELHPSHDYLYAVSEVADADGKGSGAITAFSFDKKTGKLTKLNHQFSKGAGPCHVTVDHEGKYVLAANYRGGSVVALPIQKDGSLGEATGFAQHEGSGPNKQRQKEPHAHSINMSPKNRFAVAADLGIDKLLIYKLNQKTGELTLHDPPFTKTPAGGGPRHFAFHPNAKFAYVNNEMTSSVTALTYDMEAGTLTPIQTISTLPAEHPGNSTAEVRVHPSGKWVYVSNRGHDSIAMFKVDKETGKLTGMGHESTRGQTPRNFNIDPTGKFLLAANQKTGNVAVFQVANSGELRFTGNEIKVPAPVCIRFAPMK